MSWYSANTDNPTRRTLAVELPDGYARGILTAHKLNIVALHVRYSKLLDDLLVSAAGIRYNWGKSKETYSARAWFTRLYVSNAILRKDAIHAELLVDCVVKILHDHPDLTLVSGKPLSLAIRRKLYRAFRTSLLAALRNRRTVRH